MKINLIKACSIASIAGILAIPALAHAQVSLSTAGSATGGADQSAPAVSAPVTAGGNTGGADTGTNSSGSTMTTGGSNTGGADTSSSGTSMTTGGSNTGGGETSAPAPTTAPTSVGSSGSSVSSGGSSVGNVGTVAPVTYAAGSCPLITDLLKIGGDNDSAQVTKLQTFLKDSEHLDVEITGTFDAQTELAVKDFQKKYMDTIMGPWDATRTTGVVYITTMKKINELACKQALTLDNDELATIQAYNQNVANGQNGDATGATVSPSGNDTATGTPDVGATNDQPQNTAAVANTSIWKRFWNFIVSLFR